MLLRLYNHATCNAAVGKATMAKQGGLGSRLDAAVPNWNSFRRKLADAPQRATSGCITIIISSGLDQDDPFNGF